MHKAISFTVAAAALAIVATSSVSVSNAATSAAGVKARVASARSHIATTTIAVRHASSTEARDLRHASTTTARIQKAEVRGVSEIDARIQSLTELVARIQGMKNIGDSDKVSIETSMQSEITDLQALRTTIASSSTSVSTTTVRSELQSITQGHRVYLLVEPRVRILAEADRINTLVAMMTALSAKLQARAASSTATTTVPSSALISDINVKLVDATAQTQAAVAEVTPLKVDNGDKAIAASNANTLKDARLKLQAAQKDIVAARQDIEQIVGKSGSRR